MYDTHLHSAWGEVSCANCHVDSRMDRLAWDLGNSGAMQTIDVNCNMGVDQFGLDCPDFHPTATDDHADHAGFDRERIALAW